MPFYQTICISKIKGIAEQQAAVLFRDIFKLPNQLPSAENFFLIGVIKPDGLPAWFAVKNSTGFDLASLQQLAKQVLEKVSLNNTLDSEQLFSENDEEVRLVFEEIISGCRTGLPENTNFALCSLVKIDDYHLINICSAGFSTMLDNKPISKPQVPQMQITSVSATQNIVLQDEGSGQVYATVTVPKDDVVEEAIQTLRVLAIIEEITLLQRAQERLLREKKHHITPIIEEIIHLANFTKNQYVADQDTSNTDIQDLQDSLHAVNACLEKPGKAGFENLKQYIHQLDKHDRLPLLVGYYKQLLAQMNLAQIVTALPVNEVKTASVKLLENMAKICQDEYVPAVVNGKPKTLELDAIRQVQLQAMQLVTNFAEIADEYLCYPFTHRYGSAIANLEKNPAAQYFAVMQEIINNAKELQAAKNRISQTTAYECLDKAKQRYQQAVVGKAVANFIAHVNLLNGAASDTEKQRLVSIVERTAAYLKAPTEKAYGQYKAFANTVAGHSVLWQQLAGAMLILAGVVLAIACGAVIAASHGVALPVAVPAVSQAATWVAAGSAVLLSGFGIFACYNGRTKGLSKAMHECAFVAHQEANKAAAKSEDEQRLLAPNVSAS